MNLQSVSELFRNHRFPPFDSVFFFFSLLFQKCPKRTRSGFSVLCAVSKGTGTPPARYLFPCFRSLPNTWKVQHQFKQEATSEGFFSHRRLKQRSYFFLFCFLRIIQAKLLWFHCVCPHRTQNLQMLVEQRQILALLLPWHLNLIKAGDFMCDC